MAGRCRLDNALGSGGLSGAGKGSTIANAVKSGGPEQRRVGVSEPDVGEVLWIMAVELPFFSPQQIFRF